MQLGKNKLPIRKKWLEKFEKNNPSVSLNILHIKKNEYISCQQNLNHENQIIISMIPNRDGCHYLAVKKCSHS